MLYQTLTVWYKRIPKYQRSIQSLKYQRSMQSLKYQRCKVWNISGLCKVWNINGLCKDLKMIKKNCSLRPIFRSFLADENLACLYLVHLVKLWVEVWQAHFKLEQVYYKYDETSETTVRIFFWYPWFPTTLNLLIIYFIVYRFET